MAVSKISVVFIDKIITETKIGICD